VFQEAIWDIVNEHRPASPRHVYYQAVVGHLIDKDEGRSTKNEQRVGIALNVMRERAVGYENGGMWLPESSLRQSLIMPFEWLTDNSRRRIQIEQFASKEEALADLMEYYRRDLWQTQARLVVVLCESESIAGVLESATNEYGVALYPLKGQSGKGYLWELAKEIAGAGKPVDCLYIGDRSVRRAPLDGAARCPMLTIETTAYSGHHEHLRNSRARQRRPAVGRPCRLAAGGIRCRRWPPSKAVAGPAEPRQMPASKRKRILMPSRPAPIAGVIWRVHRWARAVTGGVAVIAHGPGSVRCR
jgi:hypothetical protein